MTLGNLRGVFSSFYGTAVVATRVPVVSADAAAAAAAAAVATVARCSAGGSRLDSVSSDHWTAANQIAVMLSARLPLYLRLSATVSDTAVSLSMIIGCGTKAMKLSCFDDATDYYDILALLLRVVHENEITL